MQIVSMRKLSENKVHIGQKTRVWNPKAKDIIYCAKKGTHVIDLNVTLENLEVAYGKLKEITEKGGKVLFVGTKKQAAKAVQDEALRSGSFYISTRWLGGTLTNFVTIRKRIKRLLEIEQMEEDGTLSEGYTKKEQALIRKEAAKLNNFLGGIKEMRMLPDAVVVVDPNVDKNAVLEAKKINIPVFGICSTNSDPKTVDYMIAGNNEGVAPIKLLLTILNDAIVETKGGVTVEALQSGEEEGFTMENVVVDFEKFVAEQTKKRIEMQNLARLERLNRSKKYFSEKRVFKKEETKAEEKVEETEQASDAPKKRGRPKKEAEKEEA